MAGAAFCSQFSSHISPLLSPIVSAIEAKAIQPGRAPHGRSPRSMRRIEFNIRLSVSHAGRVPEVRLWVDSSPDGDLNSETELVLQATQPLQWEAVLDLDPGCQEFAYRIGLRAHPEAQWSLRLRDCDSGAELLADGDRLMLAKGWSVGTCSVNPAASTGSPARASRRSHLVLVRGEGWGAG
jgi:hypothetical protein